VITLPGDTFASRHSFGYLSNVGLQDLAARDEEEYVDIALSLAKDVERLRQLRAGMRQRMLASPLCDVDRFGKDLVHPKRRRHQHHFVRRLQVRFTQQVNRLIAPYVDVMLGNEEDFSAALGYEVPGTDEHLLALDPEAFKQMIRKVVNEFPFKVVATTLRKATTATRNDWGAVCYCEGSFYQAKTRENLEILDRVGGGDSFASGLIYGFLAGKDPQWAVECGAAHGALAMTTPGDTTMATLDEVLQLMKGTGARIAR